MKKPHALALLVAVALAAAGCMFFFRSTGAGGSRRDPAEWLPATTCFFIHLPDLSRTAERWQTTSLHEIADEPQWQEFVQHFPPDLEERITQSISQKLPVLLYQQWRAVDPAEIFLAELSPESAPVKALTPPSLSFGSGFGALEHPLGQQDTGEHHWSLGSQKPARWMPNPRFVTMDASNFLHDPASPLIVGVRYRGKKSEVKASVEKIRAELFQSLAAPTSVLIRAGGVEIEQLISGKTTTALAYVDDWIFLANRAEPLKELLQRWAGEAGAPASLAAEAHFAEAQRQALSEPDLRIFCRPAPEDRMRWDEIGKNPPPAKTRPTKSPEKLPEGAPARGRNDDVYFPEALGYTLKLDGRPIRDCLYLRMPHAHPAPLWKTPLGRWAPPQSLVAGAFNLEGRADLLRWELNVAGLGLYGDRLFSHLPFQEDEGWIGDLGPELSWHDEWPEDSLFGPSFVTVTEFRDRAQALALALPWRIRHCATQPDVPVDPETPIFYVGPVISDEFVQQTLALQGHYVAYGERRHATERALHLATAGGENLGQSISFQAAMQTVAAPTVGWLYVDFRRIVEQSFANMDGHLTLTFAKPHSVAGPAFLVLEHVPNAAAIGPHILPVGASIRDLPTGFVVESTGSIPLGSWFWSRYWHIDFRSVPDLSRGLQTS